MVGFLKKKNEREIIDSLDPFESVWSEGSKAHSDKKDIGLESALIEGRRLESSLEEKIK
jgi:hypothetical protein